MNYFSVDTRLIKILLFYYKFDYVLILTYFSIIIVHIISTLRSLSKDKFRKNCLRKTYEIQEAINNFISFSFVLIKNEFIYSPLVMPENRILTIKTFHNIILIMIN